MEIKKPLFSGGEIDPALHDNVDAKAWQLGLAKATNVHAGKNGRIVNDSGTYFLKKYTGDKPVKLLTIDDDSLSLIFHNDSGVSKVHSLPLVNFVDYTSVLPETSTGINTLLNDDGIKSLIAVTARHNDGNRWLYTNGPATRYRRDSLVTDVESEPVTFEDDVPDVEAVVNTIDTFANLNALPPIRDFTNISYFVLSDPTPTLRGWYKRNTTNTAWNQLSINSIADLSAGNYSDNKANWDTFTGASVQYGITLVTDGGEESQVVTINTYRPSGSTNTAEYTYYTKLPSTSTTLSSLAYTFNNVYFKNLHYSGKVTHARIYRRPVTPSGTFGTSTTFGAWGYVGDGLLSTNTPANNTVFTVSYSEFNVQADYSNQPPYVSKDLLEFTAIENLYRNFIRSNGVARYGARLVYWYNDKVLFSRVGSPNNFLKNFPVDEVNPFMLKVGTGDTTVYGVEENNGLIIFTSKGVYVGVNEFVSQADPRIKKVGDWVVSTKVQSLNTPWGVLFVDSATNTIRRIGFSERTREFVGEDISSLASHLFYSKRITSWAFKSGDDPVLVVIFEDGSALNITYDDRTRVFGFYPKETKGNYSNVTKTKQDNVDVLIYTVLRDGDTYLELESTRYNKSGRLAQSNVRTGRIPTLVSEEPILEADYIYGVKQSLNFSHSTRCSNTHLPAFEGELKRNNVEEWDGELVREAASVISDQIGNYYKAFNFITGESCLMKYDRDNEFGYPIFVVADSPLPESMRGVVLTLFNATKTVTGLDHLEGKEVSVVADEAVVSSPNNPDNYPVLQVIDGKIELPEYACFVLVGLPYVSSFETLEIDSAGNGTNLLKPKLVNTVVAKYDNTRGVYVGGELPTDDSVTNMDEAEVWNDESPVNVPAKNQTVRKSYRVQSTWKQNGKVAFRQVDPLPMEVMSVILDVTGG